MKFAFLSHVLPPSWSGQAVMIERILRGIDANKYILISCQQYEKDQAENNFIRRLPVQYYKVGSEFTFPAERSPATRLIRSGMEIARRAWQIAKVLKAERCTALVAGTGDIADLPAACAAGRLAGVPFYPHLFDDYAYQWADPKIRSITRRLEPFIMRMSEKIIVPNEFLQHEITQRFGITPAIVRNPCESNFVEERERKNLIIKNTNFSIVYTGAVYDVNFGAFRNLITALDDSVINGAALNLYTAQPQNFLESAGISGPKVLYHQHVPPEEVVKAQNSADILFIPFAFDTMIPEVIRSSAPGKLGDYLASGTPILAHVPPGSFVSWYLKTHNCGVVVEEDDPQALSRAIQRLSSDMELRITLSINARKRAKEDFIPETTTQSFLSVLESH